LSGLGTVRSWNDHPKSAGLCYRARVDISQIAYLCSIVEAHEGLAVVRTKDERLGIVEFWVSPLMQKDFEEFLSALENEIFITVAPVCEVDLGDLK
jgi:hypothetical protein